MLHELRHAAGGSSDANGSTARTGPTDADLHRHAARAGRIALATQGLLYVIVGLLAMDVARGDHDARPSQTGALESVVHQPFGRIALVVVAFGLLAHAAWRLWLAAKGEPGTADDAGSVVKRIANVGRAAVYVSFLAAAVKLLMKGGGSTGSGNKEAEATGTVLGWPGGPWLVVAAGLAFVAVAGWNVYKAVSQKFADDLDLTRVSEARESWVRRLGTVGYLGRAAAFGAIGWFLVDAGLQHDPSESRGLDDALRTLATAPFGPALLTLVAIGLLAFGAFRILDGVLRKEEELVWS